MRQVIGQTGQERVQPPAQECPLGAGLPRRVGRVVPGRPLPRDAEQLRTLPGVGPYTCGAVLSIAFEQDEPALDTNVRRVVARYAFKELPDTQAIEAKARDLLPRGRARDWNQAIMDLGATVCLARQPRCQECPLRPGCRNRDRTACCRESGSVAHL